jgi:flavin reductase (DIM6/NTAB) family NADH-FMN oxidoreductase RutF/rubredoxin
MLNIEALFNISYGLYIVSSGTPETGNGFISNTVFQVTSSPVLLAATCHKDNHTCDIIKKTEAFSVSVLNTDCSSKLIGTFGYKSGKDTDKLSGLEIKYGETGVPIILNDSIAVMECKVILQFDIGTHILFVGEVLHSDILDSSREPMTYAHYRRVRKGIAPKNAPTYIDKSLFKPKAETNYKQYQCAACGHIYSEAKGIPEAGIPPGTHFKDLPDDWVCPACGFPKEDFFEI